MNILMVNLPYSGHTNPTLGLAEELVKCGYKVTYINSEAWRSRIEAIGATFVPYDNYPARPSVNQEKRLCISAAYNTAMRIGGEYDLLVYELLFYPGKRLAEKLGIPCVRQFSMFAWNQHVLDEFIKNTALWKVFKSKKMRRKLTKTTCPQSGCEDMLDEIINNVTDLNIVYTSRQFQIFNEEFDEHFRFIGPSIYTRTSDTVIPWDKMKSPIVYISLGTVLNFNPIFYKRCIKAFAGRDVDVIVSAGNYVNKLNNHNNSDNIFIYRSVPQLEVLEHASMFITHGGMNSVNEAIYYGVPMLVAPVGSDQPTVAERVEELGIGKRICSIKTSPAELFSLAVEVMADADISKAVKQQSQYSKQAGGLAKAAELIEEYMYNNQI